MEQGGAVFGIDELFTNLDALGEKAAGELLKTAVLAGAEIVRTEAAQRAPRRSGNLARHIVVQPKDSTGHIASAVVGPDKKGFYGYFVEFGTTKMPARPFLFPAFHVKQDEIKEKMAEIVREGLGLG